MTTAPEYQLDEVDHRILYTLMQDARNTSAAALAEKAGVSGGTIGNRIEKLEQSGIIQGSTTRIDFELAGGKFVNLYLCDVPVAQRESLAQRARNIPEVINVRSLMTGQQNLHVLAVGEDMNTLRQVAHQLSECGIQIRAEELVEDDLSAPYEPFNPETTIRSAQSENVFSLSNNNNIAEIKVQQNAPITGLTVKEAKKQELLDKRALIVAVTRDDTTFEPSSETRLSVGDVVVVLTQDEARIDLTSAFQAV